LLAKKGKKVLLIDTDPQGNATSGLGVTKELELSVYDILVGDTTFNETVQEYNKYIRSFPKNIIANMNGFEKKAYFTSTDEAKTAPKVEF
jgi:LemA protein